MKGIVLLIALGLMVPAALVYADTVGADIITVYLSGGAPDLQGNNGGQVATVDINDDNGFIEADYYIQATGACDASDGTSVLLTLNLPAGVTANPTSFSRSNCLVNNLETSSTVQVVTFHVSTPGLKVITVSALDSHGSYSTSPATLKITGIVSDSTDPLITVPDDITREATGPNGAPVTFTATATDTFDDGTSNPNVTVSCIPASGSTFPLGPTTVECTATDNSGNFVTDSFDVTVEDTTPPTIGTNDDMMKEATGPDGAAVTFSNPGATDIVDTSVDVTCEPASGSTFDLGTTEVVCTAVDNFGNEDSSSFTILVQDTTDPTISTNDNIVEEANTTGGANVDFDLPTASDAVDEDVDVTCDYDSGAFFSLGDPTTVTCTATDNYENYSTSTFTVTVKDTTPPTIGTNDDMIEEATGSLGADVSFDLPTASDIADDDVTVTCDPASGSTFPLDVATTVTCTATDDYENYSTSTFTVTVKDTTAPAFDDYDDITGIEATGPLGADVSFDLPTASDAVDDDVTVTCDPASGSTFPLGLTTVTCTATDDHTNSSTTTFDVTVVDTTAPDFGASALDDIIKEGDTTGGSYVTFDIPTAIDGVDGPVTVTCDPASGAFFSLGGPTVVTCSATDEAGNTGSIAFNVTITDITPPTIDTNLNIITQATGPSGAVVIYTNPGATDIVDDNVAVSCVPASGSLFAITTTTVTCTATDDSGNSSQSTFTVTVNAYNKLTMGAGLDLGKGNTASGNIQFNGVVTTGNVVFKGGTVDFKSKSLTFVSVSVDGKTITATGSGVSGKSNTPMSFTLVATDNGEPGRADTLSMTFSNGYSVSGTLLKGNLQVHK